MQFYLNLAYFSPQENPIYNGIVYAESVCAVSIVAIRPFIKHALQYFGVLYCMKSSVRSIRLVSIVTAVLRLFQLAIVSFDKKGEHKMAL